MLDPIHGQILIICIVTSLFVRPDSWTDTHNLFCNEVLWSQIREALKKKIKNMQLLTEHSPVFSKSNQREKKNQLPHIISRP